VVLALGGVGGAPSISCLRELAGTDEDPQVRIEAVSALGKIGAKQSIETLLEVAMRDADQNVRAEAVLVLGNFFVKGTFPDESNTIKDLLYRISKTDPSAYVRDVASTTIYGR
jgi:HEAT repeat protein